MVKVYIYGAEYECPYQYEWDDHPLSTTGDMFRYSEERAHMIPDDMYEKWCKAKMLFGEVQDDMDRIHREDRKPL